MEPDEVVVQAEVRALITTDQGCLSSLHQQLTHILKQFTLPGHTMSMSLDITIREEVRP